MLKLYLQKGTIYTYLQTFLFFQISYSDFFIVILPDFHFCYFS